MITSLLYVSSSLLPLPNQAEEMDDIVSAAQLRNAQLEVTGALVFTEARFAQVLEGSAGAVDELMTSIKRDRRHRDLEIVQLIEVGSRRFPQWSMAYSGPSYYVDRHIKPLVHKRLGPEAREEVSANLIGLMQALFRAT